MKLGRNDACWCGSGVKYKNCHMAFDQKIMRYRMAGHMVPDREMIKTPAQIAGIRKAGAVNTDIINVDVTTIVDGYYGDASRMYCIGNVSDEARKLVEVTKKCTDLGLQEVKPWGHLGDIGAVISECAYQNGFTVVREIGGHGVGVQFHEEPWVSHIGTRGTDMLLVPGMIFTIEPMINAGGEEVFQDEEDGWTIYTEDGSLTAQWEYTVLVTEDGAEVLSR